MRRMGGFFGFAIPVCLVIGFVCSISPVVHADAPNDKDGQLNKGPATIIGRLPKGFVVYAVGTYAGRVDVPDVQLDNGGNRVRQAEVVVNVPDKPVVLVLTAYDPTVWRVGRTAETQIAGVIVSGHHAPALIGLEKKTPRAITSYVKKDGPFESFYAYKASRQLLKMNEQVKVLVGHEIDHFVNQPAGEAFYIGEQPEKTKVIYSDEMKVTDYVEKPEPGEPAKQPAGRKGIEELVAAGKLRPATPADIQAWVDKASEPYKRFNPDLRVDTRMWQRGAYVVLAATTLPDGLYGAHSVNIIVPDGVPMPSGSKGHNTFYKMDGTAEGPGAHAEE